VGRLVEDGRGFHHFDHEGGAAARQVVRRANSREHRVDNPDMGGARRHEQAACAMMAISAFWRRKVDLPAMFGPVISDILPPV
jgi:hypothetical protein